MAKVRLIDVVKPVCPDWRQHAHLRRVMDSFPACFIGDRVTMLKVDHPHVCKARIIIEDDRDFKPKRPLNDELDRLLSSIDLSLDS